MTEEKPSSPTASPGPGPTPRQGNACSSCHSRKVRCDLNLHESTRVSCSNCRDAGKPCEPHVRKRKHYQVDNTAPASQPSGERRIYKRSSEAGLSTTSPQETLTPSQQASYLGRSNYITAHVDIDEDDATQYRSPAPPPTGPLHEFQKKIRRNLTGIELPQGPLRQTLLRNFLQRCRPWMPLVNESDLEKFDAKNSDSLLVTAMLVAGSIVSSAPQVAQIGQRCYQRAKVLFYTGAEQNHLYTVMATIFLQWLNPSGPEHVSIDNSSFWLRISVGLAHQLGLHREPNPRMADAKLRRKMWWALISRDNQIATSHGRPRAINLEDSNVRPLRIDDFDEGDEDALLFMQFVHITSLLGDLTEHYRRGTLSERKKVDFENSLRQWIKELPAPLQLYNPETGKLREYNIKSRQLNVLYFVALIILFRQEKTNQPPSPVSLLAGSFVSGIFEEYLTWEDISHLSVTSIFYLMVTALLQISYHRFPALATARAEEIEIITLSLNELKKRFPTALGAERVVNQVMKHAATTTTTLPETTSMPRMVLTPEQRDFFSAFGPELCRKWSLVFDQPSEREFSSAEGGAAGIADLPAGGGIPTSSSMFPRPNGTGMHHQQQHHQIPNQQQQQQQQHQQQQILHSPSSPSAQQQVGIDDAAPTTELDNDTTMMTNPDTTASSLWGPNNAFSYDGDPGLFADQMGLDTGRWWWADWVPDGDLDFLAKSISP